LINVSNAPLFPKTAFSSNTIRMVVLTYEGVDPSSSTQQTLIQFGDASASNGELYLKSNKIYFRVDAGHGEDDGIWSGDCTATNATIYFLYWWYDTTVNPVVWVNGEQVTMTEVQTPTAIQALASSRWFFGASGAYGNYSSNLQGSIGNIGIWSGNLFFGQQNAANVTGSRLMRFSLQVFTDYLDHYFPCDECPDGEQVRGVVGTAGLFSSGLVPDSDVAHTWQSTEATGWQATSTYNSTTYISAEDTDDGETEKTGFRADDIPTGKTVTHIMLVSNAKAGDAGSFTHKMRIDGADATTRTISSTTATNYYDMRVVDISQSDLDGVEAWDTATATIAKGEVGGVVYWHWLVPYYMIYQLKDMVGTNELLTTDATGKATSYLSYL